MTMRMRTGAIALLSATAFVGLAACGDDKKASSSDAPKTMAITATEVGKSSKLTVPKTVPAGLVSVTLTNNGKAPHEAGLIRIDAGHSAAAAIKAISSDEDGAPIPAWVHGAGGTGSTAPGASATATQDLKPGTYIVTDTAASDQGAKLKGAFATVKVTGEDAGGDLPASTATIEAFEYGFKASGLKTGKNTISFSNTGTQLHHVIAAPMKPGATLAQVKAAFTKSNGNPPLDFDKVSGTAVLDGGAKQVTELDFAKPGKYALLCFLSDRAGGPPHVAKGMVAEVDVR
jgi:plastocyanin